MNTPILPFERIDIPDILKTIGQEGKIASVLNVCGFLLCKRGWAKVSMGDSTYIIQEGDMYIYAPSTFINIIDWSNDLQGIAYKSTLDYILPFLERVGSQKTILNIRNRPCISLSPQQQENIKEMATLVEKKVTQYKTHPQASLQRQLMLQQLKCLSEAFITELLLYYIGEQKTAPTPLNHKDKVVQDFLIHLFQHYKHEREVRFYADQQYLSPRYFSTLIRQQTGKTALTWITEMVISHSCQLLAYSDTPIKEIASELHFPTQTFFGKYFKQYTKCSPLQYRKRYHTPTAPQRN